MIGVPEGFSVSTLISEYFTISAGLLVCVCGLAIAAFIRRAVNSVGRS